MTGGNQSYVLVVTEKGFGKCVPIEAFRTQRRGGKGSTLMRFKARAGGGGKAKRDEASDGLTEGVRGDAVSNIRVCRSEDDVVISTSKGTITRQRIGAITVQNRRTTGVVLQSIDADAEHIISVDIVPGAASVPKGGETREAVAAPATTGGRKARGGK
jgi:DNA gyrase subunit A